MRTCWMLLAFLVASPAIAAEQVARCEGTLITEAPEAKTRGGRMTVMIHAASSEAPRQVHFLVDTTHSSKTLSFTLQMSPVEGEPGTLKGSTTVDGTELSLSLKGSGNHYRVGGKEIMFALLKGTAVTEGKTSLVTGTIECESETRD